MKQLETLYFNRKAECFIPKVLPHESEEKYVSRCIPYLMNKEGYTNSSQAAAVCHSLYRKHKKRTKSELEADRINNGLLERAINDIIPKFNGENK